MNYHKDPTMFFHQNDLFSVLAHKSIKESKSYLRNKVVAYIASRGREGATSDEVEQALGIPHQSASARLTELKAMGLVVPSGEARKTRSGRKARVLIVREEQ